MIETSQVMRKMQFKNLTGREEDTEPKLGETYKTQAGTSKVTWLGDINELSKKEAVHFFLANEFFDALPVHKFQKTPKGYREIMIDFDQTTNSFKFVLSPHLTIGSQVILKVFLQTSSITLIVSVLSPEYLSSLNQLNPEYSKFEHMEVSPESARYMEAISKKLGNYNGSALFIDYGHNGICSDTLRVI